MDTGKLPHAPAGTLLKRHNVTSKYTACDGPKTDLTEVDTSSVTPFQGGQA